jgi:hypothetical protein
MGFVGDVIVVVEADEAVLDRLPVDRHGQNDQNDADPKGPAEGDGRPSVPVRCSGVATRS